MSIITKPYFQALPRHGVRWEPYGYHFEDTGIDTDEEAASGETDIDCDADASTAIPVGTVIKIGTELMWVSATGTTITVQRTAAVVHATDSDIYKKVQDCVLWLPGQDDAHSTTIRDRSGNANDGTISGATWEKVPSSGIWYLNFTGDDKVVIPLTSSLTLTGALTLRTWFRTSLDTGSLTLMSAQDGGNSDIHVLLHTTGRILFYHLGLDNASTTSANSSYAVDTWYLCHCVYDLSKTYIYIDGIEVKNQEDTGTITTITLDWHLGRYAAGAAEFLTGDLALFSAFNRATSAVQALDEFNQERHFFGV